MTAKQYLYKVRNIDRQINGLLITLQETRDRLTNVTQNYDKDGAQTSAAPHKFDSLVVLNDQINERVDELVQTKADVLATISKLSDSRQREVLTAYFVNCYTWEKTAYTLGYSYQHVMRIYKEARKNVAQIIGGTE